MPPFRHRLLSISLPPSFRSSGTLYNFNKFSTNDINTRGGPYDFSSVMHYNSYAFSTNSRPTITDLRGNVLKTQVTATRQPRSCFCELFVLVTPVATAVVKEADLKIKEASETRLQHNGFSCKVLKPSRDEPSHPVHRKLHDRGRNRRLIANQRVTSNHNQHSGFKPSPAVSSTRGKIAGESAQKRSVT